MKNQKVTVKFYGSNEETEMYSFDRTTFDLIVKANETLAEMVNDKDHRIAVLERENESLKKDVISWADGSIIVNHEKELKEIRHKAHILERALKIALEMTSCEYCPKDIAEKCDSWLGLGDGENCTETLKKYCIDQAKKELGDEK